MDRYIYIYIGVLARIHMSYTFSVLEIYGLKDERESS